MADRIGVRIKSPNGWLRKSDGATIQTSDGSDLDGTKSVQIQMDCKSHATATIEMIVADVDVEVEADIFVTTLPSGRKFRLVPLGESAKRE